MEEIGILEIVIDVCVHAIEFNACVTGGGPTVVHMSGCSSGEKEWLTRVSLVPIGSEIGFAEPADLWLLNAMAFPVIREVGA